MLALIALGFAAVVTLGAFSESSAWATVVVVAVIAVVATWLSHAVDTGPPGAYMFVLAGATASSIPGAADEPWRLGLLVLAGGALSWLAHLSGILAGPRRPEKAVLAAGTAAVARLLDARRSVDRPADLPRRARPGGTGDAPVLGRPGRTAAAGRPAPAGRWNGSARSLSTSTGSWRKPSGPATTGARSTRTPPAGCARCRPTRWPTRRPHRPGSTPAPCRSVARARRGRRPRCSAAGSPWRPVLARVGVAALVAGGIGSVLGLDHAYWAVASAVLVLWQGLGWAGTLERAALRLLGTWIGLLLAAAVLAAQPAGVWLAATIVVLQGGVQLAMPRNYGLGVVVVTPLALTIGSARPPGRPRRAPVRPGPRHRRSAA